MNKRKLLQFTALLMSFLLLFSVPATAFAQEEEDGLPPPELRLEPIYPKLEAIAGSEFEFEVKLLYLRGTAPQDFDLEATAPPGWDVYMTPKYETEKKVSAIRLEPTLSNPERILVHATAPFWPLPEPGEYPITLEMSAGDLQGSVELTAVVTARYRLNVVPTTERYNTKAKPGEDNFFSVEAANLGTAPVDNIKFTTTQPEGWRITFTPEDIETLAAFDSQTVGVNIQPPTDTIAGDYNITLRASGTQATAEEIKIRVTVETPTVWGWVGVGIIVLVVAGLIVVFMRFSRR